MPDTTVACGAALVGGACAVIAEEPQRDEGEGTHR